MFHFWVADRNFLFRQVASESSGKGKKWTKLDIRTMGPRHSARVRVRPSFGGCVWILIYEVFFSSFHPRCRPTTSPPTIISSPPSQRITKGSRGRGWGLVLGPRQRPAAGSQIVSIFGLLTEISKLGRLLLSPLKRQKQDKNGHSYNGGRGTVRGSDCVLA